MRNTQPKHCRQTPAEHYTNANCPCQDVGRVLRAMDQSIAQNEIVHLYDATDAEHAAAEMECHNSVVDRNLTEYWGSDGVSHWRIHLHKGGK